MLLETGAAEAGTRAAAFAGGGTGAVTDGMVEVEEDEMEEEGVEVEEEEEASGTPAVVVEGGLTSGSDGGTETVSAGGAFRLEPGRLLGCSFASPARLGACWKVITSCW